MVFKKDGKLKFILSGTVPGVFLEMCREYILWKAGKVQKFFDKLITYGVILDYLFQHYSLMCHEHFNLKKYLNYRCFWYEDDKKKKKKMKGLDDDWRGGA